MNCVNCGHENPERALLCYWCGVDPATGEQPYHALTTPIVSVEDALAMPEVTLPPQIEVPSTMPVPSVHIDVPDLNSFDLAMPDFPPIEIAPPPDIPDQSAFTSVRRRARHRPIVRAAPTRPVVTRPVLPGWGRVLVFAGGLGILFALGSALVGAVGAASLGSAFCLLGLLGTAVVLWVGLLLTRAGKRIFERAGAVYERLEVLGQVLRELVPGAVEELPVNLPKRMGVLNQPVAYSELRSLAAQEGEPRIETAIDLLTGAIASLVGRDDVVLARRTYPVEARGMLIRPTRTEVSVPVLTRRRIHVGPGELEDEIVQHLRTDQPLSVEELVRAVVGPAGRQGAQRLVAWVNKALSENPPDLEALTSPDEALAEFERFREAVRQADPELYDLLEEEIRRGLGAVAQRAVPSSLQDLIRYTSADSSPSRQSQRRSGSRRKG